MYFAEKMILFGLKNSPTTRIPYHALIENVLEYPSGRRTALERRIETTHISRKQWKIFQFDCHNDRERFSFHKNFREPVIEGS